LIAFLNELHADHLVLELARRPDSDLEALKQVRPEISLGLGVIDVKVNQVETPNEVARRIERAGSAGCTRTAACGCCTDRWPSARSPPWFKAGICTWADKVTLSTRTFLFLL